MRTSPFALLLLIACAPLSRTEALQHFSDEATVTGVVGFPKDGPPGACDRLTLEAVSDDGKPIGHLAVHAGKNRCLYTLDDVPPGIGISIVPRLTEGWRCNDGTTPRAQPPRVAMTLVPQETRTLDFSSSCLGQPQASQP